MCGQRGHTVDLSVEARNLNCNKKCTKYQALVQLKKIKAPKIKKNAEKSINSLKSKKNKNKNKSKKEELMFLKNK